MDRTFCGEDLDGVIAVVCEGEDKVEMTAQEQNDYDVAVRCVAQIMNRMKDGTPIERD